MKMKNIIMSGIAAMTLFTACNDSFLEKNPIGTSGETNAFQTYDNFKSYMYNCYGLFTDARIYTNFSGGSYYSGGQWSSDYHAGIMTARDNSFNPYAYDGISVTPSSDNWNF